MAPKVAPSSPASTVRWTGTSLPVAYRLFFLMIEPISALVGAFFAHFRQVSYLSWTTHSPESVSEQLLASDASVSVTLSQLANLYLLFALNEALVLRSTSDLRVWRTLLFGLLVADFGHLYSLRVIGGLSAPVYWDVTSWNAMDAGNVGFVYAGASMRIAFLLGVGLQSGAGKKTA